MRESAYSEADKSAFRKTSPRNSTLSPAGDARTSNTQTEIMEGNLPIRLDSTSVTVNGKPALSNTYSRRRLTS